MVDPVCETVSDFALDFFFGVHQLSFIKYSLSSALSYESQVHTNNEKSTESHVGDFDANSFLCNYKWRDLTNFRL